MIDRDLLAALEKVRPEDAKWRIYISEDYAAVEELCPLLEWKELALYLHRYPSRTASLRAFCWLLLEEMLAANQRVSIDRFGKGYVVEVYDRGNESAEEGDEYSLEEAVMRAYVAWKEGEKE